MQILWEDFNGAATTVARSYPAEWREIERVLSHMPLHLKGSGQRGIVDTAIFDPIGTNEYIKRALQSLGWETNIGIPAEHSYFGTDVDLAKRGVVGEAQFSTYPYLMNNLVRTDLFHRLDVRIVGERIGLLVVIMKSRVFPASQGTLYYEQGLRQIHALADSNIFKIPTRLVGFFEEAPTAIDAIWTQYTGRTSRTIVSQDTRRCQIDPGRTPRSRARITVPPAVSR